MVKAELGQLVGLCNLCSSAEAQAQLEKLECLNSFI